MQKLGSKKLVINLYTPLTNIPTPLLKFNPQLTEEGNQLTFIYDPTREDNAISNLLDQLKEHSIKYKDIETHQSSLEEIFIQLVNA